MNAIAIPFWVVVGVATMMIMTSTFLALKIRSLKKSKVIEKEQKSQITDLSSRTSFLETSLIDTKKDFKKAKEELNEFKDIEARGNAQILKLKESLEAVSKDNELLKKENASQKENASRQQKELGEAIALRSKLESNLKELSDRKEKMAARIEELESSVKQLSQAKQASQEAVANQKQELEQVSSQRLELNDQLQGKEQELHKLLNSNRMMAVKIEELEAKVTTLSEKYEADEKSISHQQQELEQLSAQRLELRNILQEREQEIQKLKDSNDEMTNKIGELESGLKVYTDENTTGQQVIQHQGKELEQALAENSTLHDTLVDRERKIQKLEVDAKRMNERIKDLESSVSELGELKKKNQEEVLRQKQELEQALARGSKLESAVKEEEGKIHKLEDVDQAISTELKEARALIQGLQKEAVAQSIIIAELKKEREKQLLDQEALAVRKQSESDEALKRKEVALAEILSQNQLVNEARMKRAQQFQKKYRGNLLRFLFVNQDIDENKLVECLSSKLGVPYLPLGNYDIEDKIISLVPSGVVEEHWVFPVDQAAGELMVAMVDPFDNEAIEKLEKLSGCMVQAYIGLFSEIAGKIQDFYKVNIRGTDAEGNPVCPLFIKTQEYRGRERRRAVRLKKEITVRVADDNSAFSSITHDIGWDGLSFKSKHELPVYSVVTLQLSLPLPGGGTEEEKDNRLFIPAVGQVIRANAQEDNSFMIGTRLLKIPKDDLNTVIRSKPAVQKKE